jgi:hypothetical protein
MYILHVHITCPYCMPMSTVYCMYMLHVLVACRCLMSVLLVHAAAAVVRCEFSGSSSSCGICKSLIISSFSTTARATIAAPRICSLPHLGNKLNITRVITIPPEEQELQRPQKYHRHHCHAIMIISKIGNCLTCHERLLIEYECEMHESSEQMLLFI